MDIGSPIFLVSLLIIALGGYIIFELLREPHSTSANSIFRPHAIQILGLTFLLPTIMIVSLSGKIDAEAITALLGSIVGYLFGSSRSGDPGRTNEG